MSIVRVLTKWFVRASAAVLLLYAGLLLVVWFPWFHYIPGSISGQVKDAETGEPVPDAVAMLIFTYTKAMGYHGSIRGTIHMAEAVTDENGRYKFDSFGPVLNREKVYPIKRGPSVRIFKQGYRPTFVFNEAGNLLWVRFKPSVAPVLLERFESNEAEKDFWMTDEGRRRWATRVSTYPCGWSIATNYFIERDRVVRAVRGLLADEDKHKAGRLLTRENVLSLTGSGESGCGDPLEIFKVPISENAMHSLKIKPNELRVFSADHIKQGN